MATFLNAVTAPVHPVVVQMAAFREWMKPYEAPVYRLALNLTGNAEDAEKVLVETFVKAGRQFPHVAEEQRTYAWLVRLAVRESLCMARARCGDMRGWLLEQNTPLEERQRDVQPWRDKPEEMFAPRQWRVILMSALDSLTPVDRAVFVLRDLEKFTDAQIAETLCIAAAEVRLRLNRARVLLRDQLDPVCRVGAEFLPRPRPRPHSIRLRLVRAPRKGLRRAVYL